MTPLARKLQIKPGSRVWLRGAPGDVRALLEPVPDDASLVTTARGATHALLFVTTRAEIAALVGRALPPIAWIAYPKKSSGVASELSRDEGWDPLFDAGFVGVASVAIDATWSALRVRPGTDEERAKAKALRAGMRRPGARRTSTKAPAKLPEDLVRALARNAAARKTAGALAPSHVREYATWIEEAKKAETRAARIARAVEMLAAGQRDRNAKYRGGKTR